MRQIEPKQSYAGRVCIEIGPGYCNLFIPCKKDGMAILYSGALVIFLTIFLIVSGYSTIMQYEHHEKFNFLWVAPIISVFLLPLVVRVYLWNTIGKEVILIKDDFLTIFRTNLLFNKPQTYQLNVIRNFRTDFDDEGYDQTRWHSSRSFATSGKLNLEIKLGGSLLFDYEGKTVRFADSVDKADADEILQKLIETKVIKPGNLKPLKAD